MERAGRRAYIGRLTMGEGALRLEGRGTGGPPVERRIDFDELGEVLIARRDADRLDGWPALVLERESGPLRLEALPSVPTRDGNEEC